MDARRVQQKDDASTTDSSEEEEKSETKNRKKTLKAAQVKANKEKVVARALRSEAREKQKLDAPTAQLAPGPPARPGRRWPAKTAAVVG